MTWPSADAELAAMSLFAGPGGHAAELSGRAPTEPAAMPTDAEPAPGEPGPDDGAAQR